MNRFSKKNIYLLALSILSVTSCDKFLGETPDNRVALNTTEKAAQLITNAYSSAGYDFTDWMTDNVSFSFGTSKLTQHNQAFGWEDMTPSSQDTPTYFWESTYDAIAHANEVLAVIDDLPGERDQKNAVKGEALLTRAYGHFMLVNLFAKHYDPDHAATDLGIPYVEEPETEFIKRYTRYSVEEVYDKVETDLKAGLKLVDGSFYANSGKYHFTENAALAFASRFYLFKGDLDNCLKYSNQMLGSDPDGFVKDMPTLKRTTTTDNYVVAYHSPSDVSNLLLVRQVSNFHAPSLGHWPSNSLYAAIFRDNNPYPSTGDVREQPSWVVGDQEGAAPAKYEFLFERSSLTSNVGLNYTIFLGFRGEEVLLNRAECYILQNKLSLALADLQILVNKRYVDDSSLPVNPTLTLSLIKSHYGISNNQDVALQYLLDERQKEFISEGMRWFDIKRYKMVVKHQQPQLGLLTLEADDPRKAIQIPKAAIDVGHLEPNPR